jgi:hypothetical protein
MATENVTLWPMATESVKKASGLRALRRTFGRYSCMRIVLTGIRELSQPRLWGLSPG